MGDASGPGSCAAHGAADASPPPASIPIADQLRAIVSAVEGLEADAANDLAYAACAQRGSRELRALFAEYGVSADLNWPQWIAAIRARLDAAEPVSPTCQLTGCQHLRHEADMRAATEEIARLKARVEALERQLRGDA